MQDGAFGNTTAPAPPDSPVDYSSPRAHIPCLCAPPARGRPRVLARLPRGSRPPTSTKNVSPRIPSTDAPATAQQNLAPKQDYVVICALQTAAVLRAPLRGRLRRRAWFWVRSRRRRGLRRRGTRAASSARTARQSARDLLRRLVLTCRKTLTARVVATATPTTEYH